MTTKTGENQDEKGYNGWANYETWNVSLWLNNEEGSYRYWRDAAQELKEEVADEEWSYRTWSAEEYCRFTLADRLKNEITEQHPLQNASMWSDLLSAALSEVDWYEIADAFLED